VFQVEEEARRARVGAGKPVGGRGTFGRCRCNVEGRGGASGGREAVGAVLEGTWRRIKRRGGSWGSGKWPTGGGRAQSENRERKGLEVDHED
jgi:hypothetical protein